MPPNLIPPHWTNPVQEFIETFVKTSLDTCQIHKLAGDASGRLYWRLSLDKKSWIVLEQAPFPKEGKNHPYLTVQRHLLKHNVHVPQVFDFSPEYGFIIVEDFG